MKKNKQRKDSLSKWGFWNLGFYAGKAMVLEDILDDLKELT